MKVWKKYKDYIRKKFNIEKPKAATWDGWNEWHDKTKNKNPRGYFWLETFPNFFEDNWTYVIRQFGDMKRWVRYRTFDRYHIIDTGLEPGFREFDERCLHGCFSMLVDYVEKDLAWRSALFSEEDYSKYPWWGRGLFRVKVSRQPEIGVKHLRWESGLDNPNLSPTSRSDYQAERAREILDLYHWWKFVRPLRKDPMDLGGWSAICSEHKQNDKSILSNKNKSNTDRQREREALDKTHAIEQAFEDEDTDQLIRLIKIRQGLWT